MRSIRTLGISCDGLAGPSFMSGDLIGALQDMCSSVVCFIRAGFVVMKIRTTVRSLNSSGGASLRNRCLAFLAIKPNKSIQKR